MQVGTISKLFKEKEYGCLIAKNGEGAHFHKHCLWDTQFSDLREGQEVEYESQPSYRGVLAFEIRPCVKSPLL